ncbi:pogo transposable element with KRAB domain-like protein [Aphelenchoides avenae]|nr:pogo transposable element with KRAB domain-like protein [Aphelenchus avenae]
MFSLYYDWMVHGDREETEGGNPKPPPHEVYLQWIVDAWKSIPREALAASFKTCGITTALDGSEDHLIHCIKPNGPIPSGRGALEEARILDGAALEEALVLDDEDTMLLDVSDSEGGEPCPARNHVAWWRWMHVYARLPVRTLRR